MGLTHMHDTDALPAPYDVASPVRQQVGLVFASPHSGQHYPEDLMAATDLSKLSLSRSADNFVDELFSDAPDHGAPLLRAAYARAYLDLNREPWELDPQMFDEELPDHVNGTSLRVAGGLGTIPRLAADGSRIYRDHLDFAEVRERLNRVYFPYHHCLARMVEDTQLAFGHCVLIDCHSMPSVGGPHDPDAGRVRADMVLGDCFSSACSEPVIATIEHALKNRGYQVVRNKPFAGGFTTRHYGRPSQGLHAVQIEINRGLYMDETAIKPNGGMAKLTQDMKLLLTDLADMDDGIFRL